MGQEVQVLVHKDDGFFEFESEEHQAETIRHMITHPAWRGFFVPKMEQRRDHAVNLLCTPPEMRSYPVSDAELRQRIAVLNELLHDGLAKVLEWDSTLAKDEEDLEYQHNIDERTAMGHVGPLNPPR